MLCSISPGGGAGRSCGKKSLTSSARSHCSCVQARPGSSVIATGATIGNVPRSEALVTAGVSLTG
jgi:hypothetical protein